VFSPAFEALNADRRQRAVEILGYSIAQLAAARDELLDRAARS
jgi:hypothetical protein